MNYFKIKIMSMLILFVICLIVFANLTVASETSDDSMPPPFYRVLYVDLPNKAGPDVILMQELLKRYPGVDVKALTTSFGHYDFETAEQLSKFQTTAISALYGFAGISLNLRNPICIFYSFYMLMYSV